jgi:tetratricopeptide (TPR) repeat protein
MLQLDHTAVATAHLYRGIDYFRRNQFAEAIAAFDTALQFNPNYNYARWNRATALLSMGDYGQGFPEHDIAWTMFHWRGFSTIGDSAMLQELPVWRGESGSIICYHELGFGDAIMAMRYLPEMKRRAEVTLALDPCLTRLVLPFGATVTNKLPVDLTQFNFRLPLFGVMSALKQTTATIPSEPYLPAFWRRDGGRIGIAWSGRTQTMFSLQSFLSQLDIRGFTLHALQPGPTIGDVEPLPAGCDFADVADRIAGMDHVVSVDTAAIHLAGAMGHPSAHLLLPFLSDWRWWCTELWYPTLKTYRQPSADDWSAPFARVNEALR